MIKQTQWQHSKECMCRLLNIAMDDYKDTQTNRQMPDKVIPMCRYASQATQKCCSNFIMFKLPL